MSIKKNFIYEPKTISDIIWGNPESRLRIEDIVSGAIELPFCGKSAILLYGAYGTGKTTLAKMLPNAIEQGRMREDLGWEAEFIACQQGLIGPKVMSIIENKLGKISFNASRLHYFILDEVDNLTKQAQESLKSALNTSKGLFILTTNNISELDKGMLDRCVLVEMNAPSDGALISIVKQISEDIGGNLEEAELLPIIKAANGSFRNLSYNIRRLVLRRNTQNNIFI